MRRDGRRRGCGRFRSPEKTYGARVSWVGSIVAEVSRVEVGRTLSNSLASRSRASSVSVSGSGSGSGSGFIPEMGIDEIGFLLSVVVGSGSGLIADGCVVDGESCDLNDLLGSVLISLGLFGFSDMAMMRKRLASVMRDVSL